MKMRGNFEEEGHEIEQFNDIGQKQDGQDSLAALTIEAGDKIWWPPGGKLGTRDKKLATFPRTIRALQTAHALEHQALDVD